MTDAVDGTLYLTLFGKRHLIVDLDISSLDDFNVNKSTTLPPVDVDKSFNLVDKSISCPPVDASVKIDVDAKAHAVATIGVAASGTVVPPKVSDFALIAGILVFSCCGQVTKRVLVSRSER